MSTSREEDDIKNLINTYNRRLQKLKEQKAVQGITVDPKVPMEIEDIEDELRKLNAKLKEVKGKQQKLSQKIPTNKMYVEISDTYYHRAKGEKRWFEFLGIILSLDNYLETSVFVRYLNITVVYDVKNPYELSFWQFFWWKKYQYAFKYTVPYPPDDSSLIKGQGWLSPTPPVSIHSYPPLIWVFDRRSDKLITFAPPVEIRKNTETILWEVVVHIPEEIWTFVEEANLKLSKIEVLIKFNDGNIKILKAQFESRFGLEASSRERILQLITSGMKN